VAIAAIPKRQLHWIANALVAWDDDEARRRDSVDFSEDAALAARVARVGGGQTLRRMKGGGADDTAMNSVLRSSPFAYSYARESSKHLCLRRRRRRPQKPYGYANLSDAYQPSGSLDVELA
jgi:hypothetical protein